MRISINKIKFKEGVSVMKNLLNVILFFCLTAGLFPAMYYVNDNSGDDTYDGSESFPWKTISKGIQASDGGDVIDLTGTFYLNDDLGVTSEGIEISKNITIQGKGRNETFIYAHPNSESAETRIFYFSSDVIGAVLKDFSIVNGNADNGGGIINYGEIFLQNMNISNCYASSGGGIYIGKAATIDNCNIFDNYASVEGAGLYINILDPEQESFFTNLSIYNNVTNGSGSGISICSLGKSNFENCTISNNSSNYTGGGLFCKGVIDGESASMTYIELSSCTFAENVSSTGTGGSIGLKGDFLNVGPGGPCTGNITCSIKNSIAANSSGCTIFFSDANGGEIFFNRYYTICSDNSMPEDGIEGNLNNEDPLLDILNYNDAQTLTHALLTGSPAIDVLTGPEYNGAPLFDQRGKAIFGDYKDLGSYEYGYPNGIDDSIIAKKYTLYQNYPNPFNPETTIKYSLSNDSRVKLSVFDITGREVTSLVDQKQNKGYYKVQFRGETLTSGMYFYRLSVNDKIVASRKMMMLK